MNKDVVNMYVILLNHKKEWNNAINYNKDGPRDYHTKWSKPDKERQIILWYCLYVESKRKKDMNELIYKTERDSQTQETNLWLSKGKVECEVE